MYWMESVYVLWPECILPKFLYSKLQPPIWLHLGDSRAILGVRAFKITLGGK